MRSACVFSSWLNDSKLISVRAIRLRASLENLSLSSYVPLSVGLEVGIRSTSSSSDHFGPCTCTPQPPCALVPTIVPYRHKASKGCVNI